MKRPNSATMALMRTIQTILPLLAAAATLTAQVIVADPKQCGESNLDTTFSIEESPVKVNLNANSSCMGSSDRGSTIRVWKYKNRYQRLAAATKDWKVSIDKGDGAPVTHKVPHNSIIGLFLYQKAADGKWKAYRGSSKNPIALTQPTILLTLRKADETKPGGLKQEHLVWDAMTIDALDNAVYPKPEGAEELRIEQVWVWQGLNPIPKKINLGTSKGKLTFQTE